MLKTSITLLALVAATAANAEAYTEHYNYKGNGADGWVSSWTECGETYASVGMYEQKQLGPNSWGGQYGWLGFGRYDWCTGDYSWGWADLSGADFTSNGARGASVTASGTGYVEEFIGCEEVTETYCWTDESGTEYCETYTWWNCQWDYLPVPYSVDLEWAPTDTYRGISNSQYKGESYVSRSRTVGTTGYGAVTGNVTFDGFSLDGGGWGNCWNATSGSSWITHF